MPCPLCSSRNFGEFFKYSDTFPDPNPGLKRPYNPKKWENPEISTVFGMDDGVFWTGFT
jgi:hypothetical protein